MRTLRWLSVAGLFLGGLGCSGVGQKMLELSGGEVEFKSGADASVPADFPMPPPEAGTLEASGKVAMGGMVTTTVQYVIPAGDESAVLDTYEQLMKHSGLTITRTTAAGGEVVTGESGATSWTAGITHEGDRTLLSLVVVQMPPG